MACFFALWVQLHFQIAGWKGLALTLSSKLRVKRRCFTAAEPVLTKPCPGPTVQQRALNHPKDAQVPLYTPAHLFLLACSTWTKGHGVKGWGHRMGSREDNSQLLWGLVVQQQCTHTYCTCRKKNTFALTRVAQIHLALIVGSREIVLHGADLRKLIIKTLQGSMC